MVLEVSGARGQRLSSASRGNREQGTIETTALLPELKRRCGTQLSYNMYDLKNAASIPASRPLMLVPSKHNTGKRPRICVVVSMRMPWLFLCCYGWSPCVSHLCKSGSKNHLGYLESKSCAIARAQEPLAPARVAREAVFAKEVNHNFHLSTHFYTECHFPALNRHGGRRISSQVSC